MSFQTLSGLLSAAVGTNGLKAYSAAPLASADLNNTFGDGQGPTVYGLASGVLAGGACTASVLNVTIPAGTAFYARQVWVNAADIVQPVTDSATSWIWGCSDGQVRVTTGATISLPGGWDGASACLLTKAVASGGAAVVDNAQAQLARRVDNTNRLTNDFGVFAQAAVVPSGATAIVPSGYQRSWFARLSVQGRLSVRGRVRISA